LHQFELVRLCALWDSVDLGKENVPTIIELIGQSDVVKNVLEVLAKETASHWEGKGGQILIDPSDDEPGLQAVAAEALARNEKEFGEQQAQEARAALRKAIDDARAIMDSARLRSIMRAPRKIAASPGPVRI
jgi:hypothetical protein